MSTFTLESFDLCSLPSLPLSEQSKLPTCAGVYFALSAQGRVVYIGRSIHIRQRLKRHHKASLLKALDGVRIAWLQESNSFALQRIETALIKYFNPPLNKIPAVLKAEDAENLIQYLIFNENNHTNNVIPLNKFSKTPISKTNGLLNLKPSKGNPHSSFEPSRRIPFEFEDIILEQSERIKHLENEVAALRLMFQEQAQAHCELTKALAEQVKVVSDLLRSQTNNS